MPDSISTIASKWGAATQKLSDVLGREPAPNRTRKEIVHWCKLVAERDSEVAVIANAAKDLGFTMPSNVEVQANVAKAADWLARLDEEDRRRATRGQKNGDKDEEAKTVANNTEEQSEGDSNDENAGVVIQDAEAVDAQGVGIGTWKGGEVYYYQQCSVCATKPRTTCRGPLGATCQPCKKTGRLAECSLTPHGSELDAGPSSQTPNTRKRNRDGLAGSASTSSASGPVVGAGAGAGSLEPEEQRPKKSRTVGRPRKSGTSEAPQAAAKSTLITSRKTTGGRNPRKLDTGVKVGGGGVAGEKEKELASIIPVAPKIAPAAEATVKIADEVEAIWVQVEMLQDEVGMLREELNIERERNSVQREQSAMLQKQVADLALELEWLRRTTTV